VPTSPGRDEVQDRDLLYRALFEIRAELRAVRAGLARLGVDGDDTPGEAIVHVPRAPFADDLAVPMFTPAPSDPEMEVAYEPPAPLAFDAADTHFEIEDAPPAGAARPPESFAQALEDGLPLPTIEEAESLLIAEALKRYEGNRRLSADALGISERTLYRKIRDDE